MSGTLAAILGGAAGALVLVGIIVLFIWFYLSRHRSVSRTSETGSSDPSIQVGRHVGVELSSVRETRRFQMDELSLATKNFSDNNLIGQGKFGEVYKGLLHDGMLVAIKKRLGAPTQEFIEEVHYLSPIQHRNLVTLLGYCQENNLQFLIYDYIPNGSVSAHLYGTAQHPREKLEFKHRLSIALGAAKDENFIAKVADAGLRNFLGRFNNNNAGSSSQAAAADEIFLAPEVKEFGRFSEKSDVYSYGVFLLELVSGREATDVPSSESSQNLVEWVQNFQENSNVGSMIDGRMGNRFTAEGMEELIELIIQLVQVSSDRRPLMNYVVMQLDKILEKEMSLTTVMGEGTPNVILGSQLFKASK
ncbi:proline-rich receptor-like protein kinase PERK8 isoform X2 [Cannabis sativa]|uniref:proline-rich receptor-like protein kinase PERK8 isoform X2 n=1 Tax=Cannabis sativa TaxID=3483 RepID=UPI0011DF6F9E|nr:proline-rich receptor-like protein kinase PERK8 isoform X2 [Cannabis sativa]